MFAEIDIEIRLQHKLGADRVETFTAVPSNPQDRLKDAGKEREIQVSSTFTLYNLISYLRRVGPLLISLEGMERY